MITDMWYLLLYIAQFKGACLKQAIYLRKQDNCVHKTIKINKTLQFAMLST